MREHRPRERWRTAGRGGSVGADERAGAHVAPSGPPDRSRAGRGLLRRDRHRVALRGRSRGQLPRGARVLAALAWRRRAPLVPLALALVVIELSNLAAPALAETGAFLVGILLAIYSAGRYTRGRALIAGVALVVAAIPLAAIEPGEPVALHGHRVLRGVLRRARSSSGATRRRRPSASACSWPSATCSAQRGGRRGAHADRARAARRRRPRDQRHGPAGARRAAHARPTTPSRDARGARRDRARRRAGAGRDAPPARAAARRATTELALAPPPSLRRHRRARRGRCAPRACRSRSRSRASRSSCRPASTSRPTGSCRRR